MSSKALEAPDGIATIAVGCSALPFFADASKDPTASSKRPVRLRSIYARLRAAYNDIPMEGTADREAIVALAKV